MDEIKKPFIDTAMYNFNCTPKNLIVLKEEAHLTPQIRMDM